MFSFINSVQSLYRFLIAFGNLFQDVLLLALRVYWGYGFYMAGVSKFSKVASLASYFSSINIPFPEFSVYLVAIIETVCGIMLVAGLASRLATVPLIFTMLGALFFAHTGGTMQIFSDQAVFLAQPPVTYLLVSLVIFAFGPGSISADYAIEKTVFKR